MCSLYLLKYATATTQKLQSHDVRQGERTRFGHDYEYPPDISKVLCVLYPLMLNYDVLFQDADLVWLNDPVPFFHDEGLKKWDVLFQHDGSNSVRYAVSRLPLYPLHSITFECILPS